GSPDAGAGRALALAGGGRHATAVSADPCRHIHREEFDHRVSAAARSHHAADEKSRMKLQSPTILASSGVLLALATLLGAFGAHGLRAQLAPNELSVFLTADRYQFFQSLGLLGVGLSARSMDGALLSWSAALLL